MSSIESIATPTLPTSPCAIGVVGVVAHLGRQVEGDRQAAGAGRDQLVVALVGLRGGAEAGVLAHRPGPAGVHRRVDAAGERVLARLAEPGRRVQAGERLRAVDRLERQTGLGAVLVARAGRAGRGSFACGHARTVRRPVVPLHREASHSPGLRTRGPWAGCEDRRVTPESAVEQVERALARRPTRWTGWSPRCAPATTRRTGAGPGAGRRGPRGPVPRAAARPAGAGEGQRRHRRPAHHRRVAGAGRAAAPEPRRAAGAAGCATPGWSCSARPTSASGPTSATRARPRAGARTAA